MSSGAPNCVEDFHPHGPYHRDQYGDDRDEDEDHHVSGSLLSIHRESDRSVRKLERVTVHEGGEGEGDGGETNERSDDGVDDCFDDVRDRE